MAIEVLVELHTRAEFMTELQLDKLFNRLWASIKSVIAWIYIEFIIQACLVDSKGSNCRPFIHTHDLSGTIRFGVRLDRLPSGRIRCHLQAFCVALVCLLLIGLNRHNLPSRWGTSSSDAVWRRWL